MDKQIFAKVGLCILIGINVGAYYVFWPRPDGSSKPEPRRPHGEGESQLKPEKTTEPARPKELQSKTMQAAAPLASADDDRLSKLLDHIKKDAAPAPTPNPFADNNPPAPVLPPPNPFADKNPPAPVKPGELPAIPMVPIGQPKPLPPLKLDGEVRPIEIPKEIEQIQHVGVTSPLTPRMPQASSPWTFTVENGALGQKLVVARLSNPKCEFRIYCERISNKADGVEFEATDALLEAAGAGVRCKRLTVPVSQPPRIIFEGDVGIETGTPFGCSMHAPRIVWDLHPAPQYSRPVTLPGALGPPKQN
jgi:hypothetical protein